MAKKTVCLAMSLLLALSTTAVAVEGAGLGSHQKVGGLTARVDFLYDRLEEFSSLLDKSQTELDELLFALNFDGEQTIRFVSDEISFQAYTGVLRGAEGTLVGRSGNALDQSLLLAQLLKDAGYEARIARGTLEADDARRLVYAMNNELSWPSPFESQAELDRGLLLLASESAGGEQGGAVEVSRVLSEELNSESSQEALVRNIVDASAPLYERRHTSPDFEAMLVEEQRDYFWVEYRLALADDWQAAHPAFADMDGPTVAVNEYFGDRIPEDLQHRLRVGAFIETRLGDSTRVHSLMSRWERPAANAAFTPQSLTLMPINDFRKAGELDLMGTLAEADFFTLSMNGQLAPGTVVFSLDGLVGPTEAMTGPGAFLATVTEKGMGAAQALSGLGSSNESDEADQAIGSLERVWFEFSLIAPDGRESRSVREVLSTTESGDKIISGRLAPGDDWKRHARIALMQNREIILATSSVNPAYSVAKHVSYLNDSRRSVDRLVELQLQGALDDKLEEIMELDPVPNYRAFQFLAMANSSTGYEAEHVSYLAQPMLATFNRGFSQKDDALYPYEQTDIVFNARRSVGFEEGKVGRALRASAEKGVWDSHFEALAGSMPGGSATQRSAFDILSSRTQGLVYIGPSETSRLGDLGLKPPFHRVAMNELESGNGLILPGDVGSADAAWWRVDVESGTLTAMMIGPGGYGGATATEYIIKIFGVGLSLVYLLHGIYSCFVNESGLELFCCLFDTILTGALIAAMTYAITAVIVGLLQTTGTVIIPGAANPAAAGLAAKKTSVMVAKVVALFVTVPARTLPKLLDFRLNVCGAIID